MILEHQAGEGDDHDDDGDDHDDDDMITFLCGNLNCKFGVKIYCYIGERWTYSECRDQSYPYSTVKQ